VLLIEEPELFLRPQAQRYLYRQLRAFADNGNQPVSKEVGHDPAHRDWEASPGHSQR